MELRLLAYFGGNVLLTLLVLADATPQVGFGAAVPIALGALAGGALLALPMLLWPLAAVFGWLIVVAVYLAAARPAMRRWRRAAGEGASAASDGGLTAAEGEAASPGDVETLP